MENIVPNYDDRLDQKNDIREFCKLWKCAGLTAEYKCFACPILADLKIMAREVQIDDIKWDKKAAA